MAPQEDMLAKGIHHLSREPDDERHHEQRIHIVVNHQLPFVVLYHLCNISARTYTLRIKHGRALVTRDRKLALELPEAYLLRRWNTNTRRRMMPAQRSRPADNPTAASGTQTLRK